MSVFSQWGRLPRAQLFVAFLNAIVEPRFFAGWLKAIFLKRFFTFLPGGIQSRSFSAGLSLLSLFLPSERLRCDRVFRRVHTSFPFFVVFAILGTGARGGGFCLVFARGGLVVGGEVGGDCWGVCVVAWLLLFFFFEAIENAMPFFYQSAAIPSPKVTVTWLRVTASTFPFDNDSGVVPFSITFCAEYERTVD